MVRPGFSLISSEQPSFPPSSVRIAFIWCGLEGVRLAGGERQAFGREKTSTMQRGKAVHSRGSSPTDRSVHESGLAGHL